MGGEEGNDQFWRRGYGAIAGCRFSALFLEAWTWCYCLQGANFCFVFSFYFQCRQFYADTQENNNEFSFLANTTRFFFSLKTQHFFFLLSRVYAGGLWHCFNRVLVQFASSHTCSEYHISQKRKWNYAATDHTSINA